MFINYDPEEYSPLEPLWPHALVSRGVAAVAALILLAALTFFWPEFLMPSARPSAGGAPSITAVLPWYFWPAAGLSRLLSAGFALVITLAGGAVFIMLPFWDKAERGYFWDRYVYSRLVLAWLILTIFFGVWGIIS
jgi:quinol-cytochrome oxidoreductase complex cytochrome b subunit